MQPQLQTTPDQLHLVMNVNICIPLARRYVADIVTSGEPMSRNPKHSICSSVFSSTCLLQVTAYALNPKAVIMECISLHDDIFPEMAKVRSTGNSLCKDT